MNWVQLAEGVHHWNILFNAAATFGISKTLAIKVKDGETVPVHALKACRGSRGVLPVIVNLVASWRREVKFLPSPHYLLPGNHYGIS